jgi:hypothetical protein
VCKLFEADHRHKFTQDSWMAAFEQFLNDKYLSAIHSPLLSTYLPGPASERDKFELTAMNDNPTLLDFVGSTPAPVTRVLVEFSSVIYGTKQLVFAASWKGPSEQSFLLLFSWWAVCLYGSVFIRCVFFNSLNQADIVHVISYGLLPLFILGPTIGSYLPQRWKKQRATPTTEAALASSLSYLDAVYALKPDVVLHDLLPSELTFMQRLRILGLLIPPFVALTYWVPLRVLVAIVGTVVLTYRAPWIVTTRRILSRSAYARATWRYIVGWLSGNTALPLPMISRKQTLLSAESRTPPNEEVKVRKHKFVFTLLENQRWWVGIDWTAALLPSERPSWCAPISPLTSGTPQSPTSSSTQTPYVPLPPPASFPLPPATSVVLPSPTGKGFVKKTARWQWEEHGEWEVLVHREGEREVKKLRVPLKVSSNEDLPKGVLAKAAGQIGVLSSPTTQSFNENEESLTSTSSGAFPADNDFTDQDGWIYGDNKWENTAPKAGMGKVSVSILPPLGPLLICHQFTRFRRWCRVAVLVETEESVHPDEKTSFTQLEDPTVSETLRREGTSSRSRGGSMRSDATGSPERIRGRTMDSKMSDSTSQDSSLQKRLKAALKGGS